MPTVARNEDAHKWVELLTENALLDDLIREIYVREAIEMELDESKTGTSKTANEIRRK
jgi:hypothetical protein